MVTWLRICVVSTVAVGCGTAILAQDTRQTFEVASVKRNVSQNPASIQVLPNGVNVINQPLRVILQAAYEINQFRIVGGPNWIHTDRFDIVARTATPVPSGELRPMLQTLVVERFNLVARKEKRPFPAYAMVLARKNATLGPQLTLSTVECGPPPGARGANVDRKPSAQAVACGPRPGGGFGRVWLVGTPLPQLAAILGLTLGQTVLDKTGLTGRYDVDLSFAPDPARLPAGVELDRNAPEFARPSLFTAVEEQLGLKLEPFKEELDALVIESVEQPKEH